MNWKDIKNHHVIRTLLLFVGVLVCLAAFFTILDNNRKGQSKLDSQLRTIPLHTALVTIGANTYYTDLAITESERENGLSAWPNLGINRGMLFVFDTPFEYGFWMKDMDFPIDIIWIGADKKIVYIEKNVQPDSYPTKYSPDKPALYVLEIPAGESEASHFAVGDAVDISSSEID